MAGVLKFYSKLTKVAPTAEVILFTILDYKKQV